jgi:23S rRNA (cytidine2498-2'-O)-methyltransferase
MKVALAPHGFDDVLIEELGDRLREQHGRLMFYEGRDPAWAQNIWLEPVRVPFQSISEAAQRLRAIQRNWWLHPVSHHRRASLIQEKLPPLKPKALKFPTQLPTAPLGSYTILDEHTLVYSARCSSPYPDGEVPFEENKTDPPSRAYLKLWEFFTLAGQLPKPGEKVVDLGSSPGGWTWVLDRLGSEVFSVDRSPLSETLKLSSRVQHFEKNAFSVEPNEFGSLDWLFSDIICYPEKLLELVEKWQTAGTVKNFVCTIKFQGPTNFEVVDKFRAIPGAKVQHLFANKHELTWSLLRG